MHSLNKSNEKELVENKEKRYRRNRLEIILKIIIYLSGDEGPTAASLKNSSEVEDGEVPESDSDIGQSKNTKLF